MNLNTNQLLSLITMLAFTACTPSSSNETPESGVTKELAQNRKHQLSDVVYHLSFQIPEEVSASITGQLQLDFSLSDEALPVILDFRAEASQVKQVKKEKENIPFEFINDHIILPARFLEKGNNSIQIEFTAGDLSLNRSEEYLYTLFVPDRASTAFPCFDQPDIKARYQLELEVPKEWVAVANGAVEEMTSEGNKHQYRFSETKPISTYLFAFVAGRFQQRTQIQHGREMTMYFRETDSVKVANNAQEVFDLHGTALSWLENYTGIPYPFEKFDFVLIPTFQYGGMEHVGNIFYKEPSLFLDPSATENQKLGRASLIAHETAHMWFGDLVTMDWFSDVWLKEVFANFMAAKIVNPSFPEINHDLRFLMAHQPAAYGEDRSEGSHPIQQQLENLKDAGTLYGRIIYQKAPVVMQQLEQMVGEEGFQIGLQEYLKTFSFDNASWDDLINILDQQTDKDLKDWSQVWVKESNMPVLKTTVDINANQIANLQIEQTRQSPQGNYWTQYSEVVLIYEDSIARFSTQIEGPLTTIFEVVGFPEPKAILANGSKMSYGYFQLSDSDQQYLMDHVSNLEDPLLRGATWMSLYESCLNSQLEPATLLSKIMQALPKEKETLNRQNLLGYISTLYWRFLDSKKRVAYAEALENLLWQQLEATSTISSKSAYFKTYQGIAQTDRGINRLFQIWEGDYKIKGLPLSDSDLTDLACQLAILKPERSTTILDQQLSTITNPDQKQRLVFVRPALSDDPAVRDIFFESLKQAENRHYEPWVVDALGYLHHPLRAASAEKYILPSLELMEEIQATGDIFFPRRWITATLSGHQSPEAARIVRQFLEARPDYPYRLKNKILMGGDLLFRRVKG